MQFLGEEEFELQFGIIREVFCRLAFPRLR